MSFRHICNECGVEYEHQDRVHKFCTYACFLVTAAHAPKPWQRSRKIVFKDKQCLRCSQTFKATNSNGKFCNTECRARWNREHLPTEQRCSKCKKDQPLASFAIELKSGRARKTCRLCQNKVSTIRRHADGGAKHHANILKHQYSLTPEEYASLRTLQGNVCAICKRVNFDGHRLYVDHCHSSGSIRGLLCRKCNTGLGMFRDDWTTMVNAVAYLARSLYKEKKVA